VTSSMAAIADRPMSSPHQRLPQFAGWQQQGESAAALRLDSEAVPRGAGRQLRGVEPSLEPLVTAAPHAMAALLPCQEASRLLRGMDPGPVIPPPVPCREHDHLKSAHWRPHKAWVAAAHAAKVSSAADGIASAAATAHATDNSANEVVLARAGRRLALLPQEGTQMNRVRWPKGSSEPASHASTRRGASQRYSMKSRRASGARARGVHALMLSGRRVEEEGGSTGGGWARCVRRWGCAPAAVAAAAAAAAPAWGESSRARMKVVCGSSEGCATASAPALSNPLRAAAAAVAASGSSSAGKCAGGAQYSWNVK